jgi:hypothetical protein
MTTEEKKIKAIQWGKMVRDNEQYYNESEKVILYKEFLLLYRDYMASEIGNLQDIKEDAIKKFFRDYIN